MKPICSLISVENSIVILFKFYTSLLAKLDQTPEKHSPILTDILNLSYSCNREILTVGLAIVGAVSGLLNGVGGRLQPLESSDILSRLSFLSGPAKISSFIGFDFLMQYKLRKLEVLITEDKINPDNKFMAKSRIMLLEHKYPTYYNFSYLFFFLFSCLF